MENEYKKSFSVQGMTCASCVRNVENTLKKMPGVKYVSVNLATEQAYLISEKEISFQEIKKAVEESGYTAMSKVPDGSVIEKRFIRSRKNFLLSISVTAVLMLLMILHMSGIHIPYFNWYEIILAGFVLFFTGRDTFKGAWIALSHKHTNMDTLVSIGAVASYITVWLELTGLNIMSFASISAMLISLHLTGRYIEARLKQKASNEIKELIGLQSQTANIQTAQGIVKVPVQAVKVGTQIIVRQGERVPLDGKIILGEGYADESMITGEPLPASRKIGDNVIGGSILSGGTITVEVLKTGEDTFLSQMIKLVQQVQGSKVPIQAFADRITLYFIPIVLSLAAAASLVWLFGYQNMMPFMMKISSFLPWINYEMGALSTAVFVFVSTMVIACPCALGLATPMALLAGTSSAARKGLIIRNGEAIQSSKNINVLLLDKTGTVTKGKPKVVQTDIDPKELNIIANIEKNSIHPLAKAIWEYNLPNYSEVPVDDVREEIGNGISARYSNTTYFIGKPEYPSKYTGLLSQGYTVLQALKNGQNIGYVAVSDPVKEDSAKAVGELKSMGIRVIMVTGDDEKTAAIISKKVGIDEFEAGVKPQGKADIVKKYQILGYKVGMVGDGINDAPALKSADIGIAIGTGTDLAIESADMVIVKGELSKVAQAINISKVTFLKIKQNLFWAFFYNIIAIPLAMAGVLHPVISELAMTFSSINVILNSLSIRKKI
ncbi:MAG: cation-translocating P-type ATPase [Petrotogaceae bacterium]|jgi:Cu+-exporting ATPase|nr:cation-translocating P-type ATPase [Petrotogaceae bacterium]